ncbi:Glycosyl hydrolases family 15 [compost metagenome]
MNTEQIIKTSKDIIKLNQHARGGYVASPLYPQYGYSWLRDGTFIAYSMDVTGESESAEQFYRWVHQVLQNRRPQVDALIHKHHQQQWIERNEFLHTRYHLDGRDDHSDWGNFQLDGYGAWLWGLTEHIRITGNSYLLQEFRASIELTIDYVKTFWLYPNYDCWEEFPDFVHPTTLACLYGGLKAIGELEGRSDLLDTAEEIKAFLINHATLEGRFVKSIQFQDEQWKPVQPGVDASLLWLSLPFHVVEPDHPLMLHTLREIENVLKHEGIQRYAGDSYYGGGEWILLTAWYGWIKAELGDTTEAQRCLDWIISKADHLGRLPEQVPSSLRNPDIHTEWLDKLGAPALPLLWSHAMFLVLSTKV